MSYTIKIQLCDDDSIITEIETEAKNIKDGEKLIAVLSASLEDWYNEYITTN